MTELKDTCKVVLEKGTTQRVKCFKFKIKELGNRELAVHQDIDRKTFSTITDAKTGLRLCSVQKEVSKVTDKEIKEALNVFIKHFTLEEILKRFKELDEKDEK